MRSAVNRYDIEACRGVPAVIQSHIIPGTMDNSGLLGSGNRFCSVPEVRVIPVSYLNKDQTVAIPHDKVDFPSRAAKVAAQQAEATVLQIPARQ
jgi:hypothetical protein